MGLQLDDGHFIALRWFQDHEGAVFQDATWFDGSDIGKRLANKAKGIYKPSGSDYALSVRKSEDGPYSDGTIVSRPDGTWTFTYREEVQAGKDSANLFTNRALRRCMEDRVPVGVFVKSVQPSKILEYGIAGLGLPVKYENGAFHFEGPYTLEASNGLVNPTLTMDNGKKRVLREIVQRQGQGIFRKRLLLAYSSKCAVTAYAAVSAVEAAHIRPYSGPFSNDVGNGILLRADIHTLFDLREIGIHPDTLKVSMSPALMKTAYARLENKSILIPEVSEFRPRRELLLYAWSEFESNNF